MADPFCPSCGTEVDEDARFCPTCGRTLLLDEALAAAEAEPGPEADQPPMSDDGARASEPETVAIPPAPSWPLPEPEPAPGPEPEPGLQPQSAQEPPIAPWADVEAAPEAPQRTEPAWSSAPPPPVPPPAAPSPGGTEMPFTWPTTLAGWLIGGGSLAAALTLLVRLGSPLNLLIFLALLAIAASVFLVGRVPTIPRQRLAILAVLMVTLGVALERAAFRVQGVESIFLIAMLVAAGGALLIELDRDRPVPPPGGSG
jgi:zinc-ribbon domain